MLHAEWHRQGLEHILAYMLAYAISLPKLCQVQPT